MKFIIIFGAGDQGREVLQLIRQINRQQPTWQCIGWLDDGIEKGTVINGLPVLGGVAELNAWPKPIDVAVAIAMPHIKKKATAKITNPHVNYPVLIHPDVLWEEEEVSIGQGTIITQGCRLTVNITIGDFVLLNVGTIVTHDVNIGDYCSVMPSVNISGAVRIEDGCYIGTGAQILQLLCIGAHTTIGAGSVVTKDIPAHCTAVGVPARVIKEYVTK